VRRPLDHSHDLVRRVEHAPDRRDIGVTDDGNLTRVGGGTRLCAAQKACTPRREVQNALLHRASARCILGRFLPKLGGALKGVAIFFASVLVTGTHLRRIGALLGLTEFAAFHGGSSAERADSGTRIRQLPRRPRTRGLVVADEREAPPAPRRRDQRGADRGVAGGDEQPGAGRQAAGMGEDARRHVQGCVHDVRRMRTPLPQNSASKDGVGCLFMWKRVRNRGSD
jgi:hypothetical protein